MEKISFLNTIYWYSNTIVDVSKNGLVKKVLFYLNYLELGFGYYNMYQHIIALPQPAGKALSHRGSTIGR